MSKCLQQMGSTAFVASQTGDRTAKIMILSATTGLGSTCAPLAATQFARMPRRWSLAFTIGAAFAVITGIFQAFTFRFKDQNGIMSSFPPISLANLRDRPGCRVPEGHRRATVGEDRGLAERCQQVQADPPHACDPPYGFLHVCVCRISGDPVGLDGHVPS